MNCKKNNVKLYNVLFPFWMLLLFPRVWLVILPGNFIIDSLVLLIGMAAWKIAEKKQWYKQYIVPIFGFGMLSDLIFVLNYYVTFRKVEKVLRLKMAILFAVVTAPYTFLIPSSWLY